MLSLHFSHKGWIEHVSPMELVLLRPDYQLEAIKVNDPHISVYINNEPIVNDTKSLKGLTGNSIKIEKLALVVNDKAKSIYYRVYTSYGFSNFYSDGIYLGISDESDKIMGFQYFIINKDDDPKEIIRALNYEVCNECGAKSQFLTDKSESLMVLYKH